MPVVKAFDNNELDTLDLSVANIEKAYEAYRQEQLESWLTITCKSLLLDLQEKNKERTFSQSRNMMHKAEIASLKMNLHN